MWLFYQQMVVPMWGLYANMIAQVLSQVSSHFIIHYHQKSVAAATQSEVIENLGSDHATSLYTHQFKLDYEASTRHAVVRKGVNWAFIASLLVFVILVICGCSLSSFAIDVLGLAGLAVESGQRFQQARVFYSVFSLANMITDQGRYLGTASDLVGLGVFSSLLVITVFIVPLTQAASLFAQWSAPMTKRQRAKNTVFNEIASSWQYMEVYVISIIICAWQLSQVSEYMVNVYCGELEDTFQSLALFGIINPDDAQCFQVKGTVEAGSWILVAASLLLFVLNHFVSAASGQKTLDDDTPAERRLHTAANGQGKDDEQGVPQDTAVTVYGKNGEQGSNPQDIAVTVFPISSRFTDYYHFATTRQTEDDCDDGEALETAVVPETNRVHNNE